MAAIKLLMKTYLNPTKLLVQFGFIFLLSSTFSTGNAQNVLKEIPETDVFSPESEEVEDPRKGIEIYDQYCWFNERPGYRENSAGSITGKVEDHYASGNILHEGTYSEGRLASFTNYFENGSVERKFKFKSEGSGDLMVNYLNGYQRKIAKYADFRVYFLQEYYDNGVMAHGEERDKKTFLPKYIVDKSYDDKVVSQIDVSDPKTFTFVQTIYSANGKKLEEGELRYLMESDEFIHEGIWFTYNMNEVVTSEVNYKAGNVSEVIKESRREDEKVYYEYDWENQVAGTSQAEENEGETAISETKSTTASSESSIPEELIRFDKNNDNFISNQEVDGAVSEFFEDDSITKEMINRLVNYFFEQE